MGKHINMKNIGFFFFINIKFSLKSYNNLFPFVKSVYCTEFLTIIIFVPLSLQGCKLVRISRRFLSQQDFWNNEDGKILDDSNIAKNYHLTRVTAFFCLTGMKLLLVDSWLTGRSVTAFSCFNKTWTRKCLVHFLWSSHLHNLTVSSANPVKRPQLKPSMTGLMVLSWYRNNSKHLESEIHHILKV